MSSVIISGDTSGAITVSAPAVAGTTTLTLPATTGTVLADTTVGVCRAWVNFNGTGTVAIRASFNVTSITDNGTGDYTVNFTTAMSDANYAAVAMSQKGSQADIIRCFNVITDVSAPTVNSIRLGHAFSSSTANDTPYAMVSIFR